MGDRQDIYVLCPFYRRTERHAIVCEGLSDESNIKQGFSTAESFRSYKKRYCDSRYRDCLVSQMLERKYDEQVQKR